MSDAKILDTDNKAFSSSKTANKRGIDVSIIAPDGGFGEVKIFQPTPVSQIDAIYGLRSETDLIIGTDDASSGSVVVSDRVSGREFLISTGTATTGSACIRSRRPTRYRPGQGMTFRWTSHFAEGATLSTQFSGAMNIGNRIGFGYNGSTFGLFKEIGGRPEMQRMTITTGAAGNETSTVTLDGTDYTVSLTASGITHTVFELADASYSGWEVQGVDTELTFISKTTGDRTGAFSFTSGAGSAAGGFAEIAAGQSVTSLFVSQTAWNIDVLDGSTNSAFLLDTTKGNVFQVAMQYLGYGSLRFNVENPNTGRFEEVHDLAYANANTGPSMDLPIFHVGARVVNNGNTSSLSLGMASGAGLIDGDPVPFRNPTGHVVTAAGVGTTFINICSIRVEKEFNGIVNLIEVFPRLVDIAVEGTKTAEIKLILNATFAGEPNWEYKKDDVSVVAISASNVAVTVTGGANELFGFGMAKSDSRTIALSKLRVGLIPGDTITIAGRATSGTTDITAGMTWQED